MGRRLQTRRDAAERSALVRLTLGYLAVFAAVVAALSLLAYLAIDANERSIVAPALETPEGLAGLAAAMRPVAFAILALDGFLLLLVGIASYALARAALRPLVAAREREERFAADAAHELRTPLTAIASLAQVHAANADEGSDAAGAFTAIARRAMEAGTLVSDLLTLARADEAAALHVEPVDLAMVAERAVREAAADFPAIAVAGTYESAIVLGDERRLLQLARNLVRNACRYAKSAVTVRVTSDAGSAVVTVSDDGPGVEPSVAPRLFARFSKGNDSTGTGLGLAIAAWVARAHRGDIAYRGGSTFEARVPLVP